MSYSLFVLVTLDFLFDLCFFRIFILTSVFIQERVFLAYVNNDGTVLSLVDCNKALNLSQILSMLSSS